MKQRAASATVTGRGRGCVGVWGRGRGGLLGNHELEFELLSYEFLNGRTRSDRGSKSVFRGKMASSQVNRGDKSMTTRSHARFCPSMDVKPVLFTFHRSQIDKRAPKEVTTYLILKILRMMSALPAMPCSVAFFFSFLRSLIVPRLRD